MMSKLVSFFKRIDLGEDYVNTNVVIHSSIDVKNSLIENIRVQLRERNEPLYLYEDKASIDYEDRYIEAVKNAVKEWKHR